MVLQQSKLDGSAQKLNVPPAAGISQGTLNWMSLFGMSSDLAQLVATRNAQALHGEYGTIIRAQGAKASLLPEADRQLGTIVRAPQTSHRHGLNSFSASDLTTAEQLFRHFQKNSPELLQAITEQLDKFQRRQQPEQVPLARPVTASGTTPQKIAPIQQIQSPEPMPAVLQKMVHHLPHQPSFLAPKPVFQEPKAPEASPYQNAPLVDALKEELTRNIMQQLLANFPSLQNVPQATFKITTKPSLFPSSPVLPSPQQAPKSGNRKPRNRLFTEEQRNILEEHYQKSSNISTLKKSQLAVAFDVSRAQIASWWSHRKLRERNDRHAEFYNKFHPDEKY